MKQETKERIIKDLRKILMNGDRYGFCDFCKYFQPCGKDCEDYMIGTLETTDENTKEKSMMDWTCIDFEYGKCKKLIGTPCENCYKNDYKNWRYNGFDEE